MATRSWLLAAGAAALLAGGAGRADAGACDPDLLMVLDRSGSMDEVLDGDVISKWTALKAAVTSITSEYAGKINFGMFTFPDDAHDTGNACNPWAGTGCVAGEECPLPSSSSRINCRLWNGVSYVANPLACPGLDVNRCERISSTNYRCRYYNAGQCTTGYAAMCTAQKPIPYVVGPGNEAGINAYLASEFPEERTPIGSAIDWMSTDPHYAGNVPASAPPRFGLFITDGMETCGVSTTTSAARITALKNRGIRTFVIGFGSDTDPGALNALAQAGGTDAPGADYFYQADDAASLQAAMRDIAGIVYRSVLSGTSAATATAPILTSTDEQWQISSAYQVEPQSTGQWHGFLRAVAKNPAGSIVKTIDFHSRLDARAWDSRVIYTRNAAGQLAALSSVLGADFQTTFSSGSTSFLTTAINAGDTCIAHAFFDSTAEFYRMFAGGSADNLTSADCTAAAASDQLEAVQIFQEFKLADVFHSTPFVMTPPELVINEPNHVSFRAAQQNRPLTTFVGTNDGALHAFAMMESAATPSNDEGMELWAYVPRFLIPRLPSGIRDHVELMDAPPLVRDVQEERTSAAATSWRTVLVSGLGRGGAGYFAIDVTNPHAPISLWEHWPAESATYANLGHAYGPAAMGRVFIASKEVPVVFLPGGFEPGNPAKGREIYIVNAITGALIKKFDASNVSGLDAPITGTPAVYDDLPGAMTTRAFVGDQKGRLWRIDTSSSDTSRWKMQRFWPVVGSSYDNATYQRAVFLPPSLAFDFQRKLVAVYGTGYIHDINDGASNYVWAIRENLALPATPGDPPLVTATQAWSAPRTLELTEKVVGDTVVFGGVVLFSTYLPTGSSCSLGSGRLYALALGDGTPKFKVNPLDPLEKVVAFTGGGTDAYQPLGAGLPSSPLIRRQATTALADSQGNYSFQGGNYRALVQVGGSTKTETFNDTTVAKDLGSLPKRADILAVAEYE